jgi:predicted dehydrogenase
MIDKTSALLVIGGGSVGERHIGILQELGYKNLHIFRQRNLPLRQITPDAVHIFTDWELVNDIKPVAAVICTPTAQHLRQALICVQMGIHVLVEKPLTHTLKGLSDLRQAVTTHQTYLQVAYMLRFHPLMQRLKAIVESRQWGDLLSMQSYWGEYLPDWHPWEDYRLSYAAQRQMGGGVALTLSHDLDLVNWLADSPVQQGHILRNYLSKLEVDTESGADISIAYESGARAHCHVNYFETVPRRWYRFVFDHASVEIDYYKSEMTLFTKEKTEVSVLPDFNRNDMFKAQALFFLENCQADNRVERSLGAIQESETIITICQDETYESRRRNKR